MEQNSESATPNFATDFAVKRGVVIGKFMPLTAGHCHLIESARRICTPNSADENSHVPRTHFEYSKSANPNANAEIFANSNVADALEKTTNDATENFANPDFFNANSTNENNANLHFEYSKSTNSNAADANFENENSGKPDVENAPIANLNLANDHSTQSNFTSANSEFSGANATFAKNESANPTNANLAYFADAETNLDGANLTVLVCTLAAEPIDGNLRARWVRETFPDVRVVHVTDEVPAYPHEHPDFWQIWRDLIRRNAPECNVIFSSEDYGARLAKELEIAHVDVDKARLQVPISATRVRENPLHNWQFLPRAVRPYFAKRVLVFGAESTGKSTLCQQLAQHFSTVWVPEFARHFYDEKGVNFEYSDVARITFGQQESEETLALDANKLLICDTDALTSAIYSRAFYGRVPHFLQRLADERRYDLVLFCENDLPWQPDAQRDSPENQRALQRVFREELQSRRIEFVTIRGQGDARLQLAIDAINAKFGAENLVN